MAAAANDFIWGRANATSDALAADLADCTDRSKTVTASVQPQSVTVYRQPHVSPAAGYAGAMIGSIIGNAIVQAREDAAAQKAYVPLCLRKRGWRPIPLNPEEANSFAAASKPEERAKWAEAFFGRPDFPGRVQATQRPPLPEVAAAPFTYGPMRLDPDTLVLTQGVVNQGGTVLKGPAGHIQTARVAADTRLPVLNGARFEAGATVYAARLMHAGQEWSFWCGPLKSGPFNLQGCVRNDPDWGFVAVVGEGSWWAVEAPDGDGSDPDVLLQLEPSDHDLVGPFDFYLVVRRVTAKEVKLTATVNRGKAWEDIWSYSVPFLSNGRAVLPFWSRRLVFTRSGDGVTATFEKDGDGTPWPWAPAPH